MDLLRLRSSLMAKSVSPYDTGLLQSSIISVVTPRGFRLIQLGNVALYGAILNAGPKKPSLVTLIFRVQSGGVTKKHINWWDKGVYNAVSTYVNSVYNGEPANTSSTYQAVAKRAKNTPAKQKAFLQNMKQVTKN